MTDVVVLQVPQGVEPWRKVDATWYGKLCMIFYADEILGYYAVEMHAQHPLRSSAERFILLARTHCMVGVHRYPYDSYAWTNWLTEKAILERHC